ncbi:MAG: tetratricopeptide repeat protein [Bacteroidia bacterium]|nr:tetratricopeptide repeat protein [Bacteroidia bacterium]
MNDTRNICPACGSALERGASVCDICGEDLTRAAAATADTAPVVPMSTAPEPRNPASTATGKPVYCTKCGSGNETGDTYCHSCGSPLRAAQARKSTKKQPAKVPAPSALFTTPQWIAVCVGSFILGAVVVAAFFPATDNAAAPAPQGGETQQAAGDKRPTIAQVNAARDAAAANPSDMGAQLRYANILHDAMMLDQAIAQYKSYLGTVPEDVDARVDLGVCYFEQKKYDEAITEMETALRVNPRHQLGNYNLGIVNLNAGNTAKAIEWFNKAVEIDPNSPYGQNASRIIAEHSTP